LSAHASHFGNYDYNRVPFAKPGTKLVAHIVADKCQSFTPQNRVGTLDLHQTITAATTWEKKSFSLSLCLWLPQTDSSWHVIVTPFEKCPIQGNLPSTFWSTSSHCFCRGCNYTW